MQLRSFDHPQRFLHGRKSSCEISSDRNWTLYK